MTGAPGHWSGMAARWRLVGPPLRPGPEDVAAFERLLSAADARPEHSLRALILGVTPELHDLAWPAGTRLRALDSSVEMVNAVWPGPADSALIGSWTEIPLADASLDVVVCDGGFGILGYPDDQAVLLGELHRVLVPGGLFIVRLFAPSGRTGSLEQIGTDLAAGRVPGLDALKLRLWGALQRNVEHGVRPRDVVENIAAMSGGLDQLVARFGWPAEHVASLDLHRDSDAVYHLVDARELGELAGRSGPFETVSVLTPDHEFGHACPVVCLRWLPGPSQALSDP